MDRLMAMRAFVRLVELRTFSAVASDLRIKQSTVSKWVLALEEEVGVQLLNRTTRSLRVIELGEQFYVRAKAILSAYEDATASLQAETGELQGTLRVSLPVVFGTLYIMPWICTFAERHPKLVLNLSFDDRYANLIDEELDVIVRVGVAVDSTLRARTLGHTIRRVVASPAYLARHGTPQTAEALSEHRVLRHSSAMSGEPWLFQKDGQLLRVMVKARLFANNSQSLVSAAVSGLGVALLADWLVDPYIERGE
ncbi:MAG: LysR family transcriptional regulator, partial [Myxococcota bacterium]